MSSKQNLFSFKHYFCLSRYWVSMTKTSYLDKLNVLCSFILKGRALIWISPCFRFYLFPPPPFFFLTLWQLVFTFGALSGTTGFAITPKMWYCVSGTYAWGKPSQFLKNIEDISVSQMFPYWRYFSITDVSFSNMLWTTATVIIRRKICYSHQWSERKCSYFPTVTLS